MTHGSRKRVFALVLWLGLSWWAAGVSAATTSTPTASVMANEAFIGPPTPEEVTLRTLVRNLGSLTWDELYADWLTSDVWYSRFRSAYLGLEQRIALRRRDARLADEEAKKAEAQRKAAETALAKLKEEIKKKEKELTKAETRKQAVATEKKKINEDLAAWSERKRKLKTPLTVIERYYKKHAQPTVDEVADWIDAEMEAHWARNGVTPAEPVDEVGFLRRVYLDLVGTVPGMEETDAYFADPSPDRRNKLIDRLVEDPRYATHFSNYWNVLLLGRGYLPDDKTRHGMVRWLRKQFSENRPYDEFVKAMLTVKLQHTGDTSPAMFLARQQANADKTAATVMSRFLGIQIQCAQCHDHRTEHWTQKDFHSIAAFFTRQRERRVVAQEYEIYDLPKGEKKYKTPAGEEHTVGMAYYNGTPFTDWRIGPDGKPVLGEDGKPIRKSLTRREQFAEQMGADPQFANMGVNRMWSLLFGRGLVHPIEDFREGNPASIPGVLEGVAEQFRVADFDQHWLIRVLGRTRAYQLSSTPPTSDPVAPGHFAVFGVKALSGEQVFDSILTATNYRQLLLAKFKDDKEKEKKVDGRIAGVRKKFLVAYAWEEEKVVDPLEGTLPQALVMANGPVTNEATRPQPGGGTVALVTSLPPARIVQRLYRAALVRDPRPNELKHGEAFLQASIRLAKAESIEGANQEGTIQESPTRKEGKPAKPAPRSIGDRAGDLLWALLNSAEFRYNH